MMREAYTDCAKGKAPNQIRCTRCASCKRGRKKCDGARPCARCMLRGGSCGDDESSPEPVEIPF
eukprot:1969694-Rhodomonas_salina.1